MSRRGITRGLPQAHTAPTTADSTITFTPAAAVSATAAVAGNVPVGFVPAAGLAGTAAVAGNSAVGFTPAASVAGATLIAQAAGRWEPSGLVEAGGKVTQWTSSGTGGTDYDLLSLGGATDPTYSATGDRGGVGPACTLVRASATKLATIAFAIAQPNTILWVVKRTAGSAANMRLYDGRTGNTHGVYLDGGGGFRVNDGAGTTIPGPVAWSQDTWYFVAGVYNGNGTNASSCWVNSTEAAGTLAGTSCSGIVLGDFGTGGGNAFDGVVERGYFWLSALSDTDILSVLSFLGF